MCVYPFGDGRTGAFAGMRGPLFIIMVPGGCYFEKYSQKSKTKCIIFEKYSHFSK